MREEEHKPFWVYIQVYWYETGDSNVGSVRRLVISFLSREPMAGMMLRRASAAKRRIRDAEKNPLISGCLSSSDLWKLPLNDKPFWFVQQISTAIPKIRIKKYRPLDAVADKEKELRPLLTIRDAILKFKKDAIPLRFLTIRRRQLGFKMTDIKFEMFMKMYPNFFEFFIHPEEKLPWCKLTPKVMELLEEEKQIHRQQEPLVVEKLKKLLMLAQDQRIRASKLALASRFFGFPDDLLTSLIPKYPEYFHLVQAGKPFLTLELVAWDESLAITEFEKNAKGKAKEMGLGDLETRGQPLAFKFQYSPGMALRKKVIEHLDNWQKLPYICPYQEIDSSETKSYMVDKRMVALLHEILSLTIDKKIWTEILRHFCQDFHLPENLAKVFNRFPGVFYMSRKGAVHTVYLREAYDKWQLIEEHPLVSLKAKYHKMVKDGPRVVAAKMKARRIR